MAWTVEVKVVLLFAVGDDLMLIVRERSGDGMVERVGDATGVFGA